MRVLVTYGSKRGGTEGLARSLGTALGEQGCEVDVLPPDKVRGVDGYDAVIVGGGLYAGRWHRQARRFVKRNARALAQRPTYFFSSGPLDDSARQKEIPPVPMVRDLMDKVGAKGHVTFDGYLAPDAKGFPASAMAKSRAGDWRDPEQITDWATVIVRQLRGTEVGGLSRR